MRGIQNILTELLLKDTRQTDDYNKVVTIVQDTQPSILETKKDAKTYGTGYMVLDKNSTPGVVEVREIPICDVRVQWPLVTNFRW